MAGTRNPPWDYDEILLALELYLLKRKVLEETDPAVIELSRVLNSLPLHPQRGSGNFRSPDAVVLKLANLRALDPTTTSAGMDAGGKRTRDIWERFADKPDEVRRLVAGIRTLGTSTLTDPVPEEEGVLEGRLLVRRHRQRERDPKLARQRRDQFFSEHGRLHCEACGLDPRDMYGPRGDAIIECHHVRPLSEGGERRTRLEDLMLLCANCHRVVHATEPWLTPDGLQRLFETAGPNSVARVIADE